MGWGQWVMGHNEECHLCGEVQGGKLLRLGSGQQLGLMT